MSFDHDVYDSFPRDAAEMSQTKPNVIGHVGQKLTLRVSNFKKLYTRGTVLPPGDRKTYDQGNLNFAFY